MATQKKKDSEIRYRRWCLTVWKCDRFPDKKSVAEELCKHKVKFLIIGAELTKTNDKPHFQTYVEWENGRTFNAIKKEFPKEANFSEAKGTAQQNIDYCSKQDTEPLKIGYVNLVNDNLSKGDIASNLVDIMISFKLNEFPHLYELICMYPQFSDYIVKNYYVLDKIYSDIKKDKYKYGSEPMQTEILISSPEDIPF